MRYEATTHLHRRYWVVVLWLYLKAATATKNNKADIRMGAVPSNGEKVIEDTIAFFRTTGVKDGVIDKIIGHDSQNIVCKIDLAWYTEEQLPPKLVNNMAFFTLSLRGTAVTTNQLPYNNWRVLKRILQLIGQCSIRFLTFKDLLLETESYQNDLIAEIRADTNPFTIPIRTITTTHVVFFGVSELIINFILSSELLNYPYSINVQCSNVRSLSFLDYYAHDYMEILKFGQLPNLESLETKMFTEKVSIDYLAISQLSQHSVWLSPTIAIGLARVVTKSFNVSQWILEKIMYVALKQIRASNINIHPVLGPKESRLLPDPKDSTYSKNMQVTKIAIFPRQCPQRPIQIQTLTVEVINVQILWISKWFGGITTIQFYHTTSAEDVENLRNTSQIHFKDFPHLRTFQTDQGEWDIYRPDSDNRPESNTVLSCKTDRVDVLTIPVELLHPDTLPALQQMLISTFGLTGHSNAHLLASKLSELTSYISQNLPCQLCEQPLGKTGVATGEPGFVRLLGCGDFSCSYCLQRHVLQDTQNRDMLHMCPNPKCRQWFNHALVGIVCVVAPGSYAIIIEPSIVGTLKPVQILPTPGK
ncbi:hypothetical protein NEDG_00622 [Nematocida displodere]|uniref:RING-type domain-containing protein n=1 Tax=Nematocida displodere TaxID=1805483 RepID=A0A177EES0_9MICR|nr:hypothetical protein NEDG_00622 [Nematocida displodere]